MVCAVETKGVVVNVRRAVALAGAVAGLVVLEPATAAPIKWVSVHLGAHRFGHVRAPDAIVARAGPKGVGFECGKPSACTPNPPSGGCGCIDVLPQGPASFDVARDGSIWLLDEVNNRLLVWRRGHAAAPARAIRLPRNLGVGDFALGREGTIYVFATPLGQGHRKLWALTATGRVRWQAPIARDGLLRLGPGGAVYTALRQEDGRTNWAQLTTAAGRPLPVAVQRRRATPFQPLPRGQRLFTTFISSHEVHFALVDRGGKVVRAWRVTSRTAVGPARATPALVGDDVVVALDVTRQTKANKNLLEHLVLRLSAHGASQRLALDAGVVWDPDGTTTTTPLRIGPDGRLYQLRTNPKTGASIARYRLG
jgi:hypothetical protein